MAHWDTMRDVAVGDRVIHYAWGQVRAVSDVTGAAMPATQPDPVADAEWGENGLLVRVSAMTIDPPIPLHDLPDRGPDAGPFDVRGEVKQGYLFRISPSAAPGLLELIDARAALPADAVLESPDAANAATDFLRVIGDDRIGAPEAMHTTGTQYTQRERRVLVDRAEAVLVQAYRDSLDPSAQISGLTCSSGRPDLVVRDQGEVEMIEAKSSATHAKVREALGQVLDYCHNTTTIFDRVTVLMPHPPEAQDIALLHRYGIDVRHRRFDGAFAHLPAPMANRETWSGDTGQTPRTIDAHPRPALPRRPPMSMQSAPSPRPGPAR